MPEHIARSRRFALIVLVIIVPALTFGMAPALAQSQDTVRTPATQPVPASYALVPGDVIDINVMGEADLSKTGLTIPPDGKINLPLIGEVLAAGLTAAQLQEQIVTALRAYLKTPVVTVSVTQARVSEQNVYLVGEVRAPGAYEIVKGWTVMEAIAKAGGLTDRASYRKATLVRHATNETISLDLDRLIRKGDQSANVPVLGGDVIVVPEFLNRVIVMGAVKSVGAFDLKEEARVLDAIVAAGGATNRAVLGSVGITRQQGVRRVLVATVDLNKIIKGADNTQNILLQHADVVYVPEKKVVWQDILSWLSGAQLVRALFGF